MSDTLPPDLPPDSRDISPVNIEDELRQSYLDYAMSVIVGRALPDVRDGLKPVHKRALFAMNELNNTHNRPYVKSARVVGDVIGKYKFKNLPLIGNRIALLDQAHYTMVKTSFFNGIKLPSIALWDSETGDIDIIKQFSYKDFENKL